MEHKHTHWITIGLLVVLVGTLFYSFGEKQIVVSTGDAVNSITVSGSAEADVMPDMAQVRVGIQTIAKDASSAQEKNSVTMNAIMNALEAAGVDNDEIETSRLNLYEDRQYNYQTGKSESKGYVAEHILTVSTEDVENVGKIVDSAVNNGANRIESIQFTLSDKLEKEVQQDLIAEASGNAKQKAELMAKSVGADVGKALSISESGYNSGVYYARNALAMDEAASVGTSVSAQEVTVTMNVNVVFALS